MARERKKRQHREPGIPRRGTAFLLGLLVIALAVVGTVTLVQKSAQGIRKWTSDTTKTQEYEAFLVPVVMNDPEPFDDVTKANMAQLVDITIWSLVYNQPATGQYEEIADGDNVGLIIPAEAVEAQFAKLFGTDIAPVHDSVSGESYDFVYEPLRKGYVVPLTSVTPTYIPKVYNAQTGNKAVVLTVGYIPANEFSQEKDGSFIQPAPDKFMKITLREREGGYYISTIQATEAPETLPANRVTTTAA